MKVYRIESPRIPHTHVGVLFVPSVGEPFVFTAYQGRGVVREPLEAFCAGRSHRLVRRIDVPSAELVRRIAVVRHRPYNLALWNCEHFASWVETMKPESPQVRVALFAAGAAFLMARAA